MKDEVMGYGLSSGDGVGLISWVCVWEGNYQRSDEGCASKDGVVLINSVKVSLTMFRTKSR